MYTHTILILQFRTVLIFFLLSRPTNKLCVVYELKIIKIYAKILLGTKICFDRLSSSFIYYSISIIKYIFLSFFSYLVHKYIYFIWNIQNVKPSVNSLSHRFCNFILVNKLASLSAKICIDSRSTIKKIILRSEISLSAYGNCRSQLSLCIHSWVLLSGSQFCLFKTKERQD